MRGSIVLANAMYGGSMPCAASAREIGGFVAGRGEALVVDAVMHDDDLAARIGTSARRRSAVYSLTHTSTGRARAAAARIIRRKYTTLRAFVPFGMVEEREVVDR